MARAKTPKRFHRPDFRYQDLRVTRLIHYVMEDGKKVMASRIVYRALDLATAKSEIPALELFEKACQAVTPEVEVRARRIGGANIQVPREVRPARALQLCLRWLLLAARARSEKSMELRLAHELVAAANGEGGAVKKRLQSHKAAKSHRAYSHLR